MFKPVHGLSGILTADITAFSASMRMDNYAFCLLKDRVKPGDHTYLVLRNGYSYEIVKVTGVSGLEVLITRAQDGTTAQAFTEGSPVEFVFTEQAIADVINEKAVGQIEITGEGIVNVQKIGDNQYVISAPPITITSEAPEILVGGEFPNFVLSAPAKADCCD